MTLSECVTIGFVTEKASNDVAFLRHMTRGQTVGRALGNKLFGPTVEIGLCVSSSKNLQDRY